MGTAAVTLLSNGELDTLALGQGDPGTLSTNDKDVGLAGGKGVVNSILEVDNVETSIVTLTVGDNTDTTHVTTASDHGNVADLELDKVLDLAGGQAGKKRMGQPGLQLVILYCGALTYLTLTVSLTLMAGSG